jgi:nitrogen fixation protein FixH
MQPTVANEHKPIPAWKSPWVIAWIGLVLAVLGVNGVMVYLAVATNPGLVVEDFYERGQNLERTMLSRNARDPGWLLRADIPQDVNAGEQTPIRFFLVDKAGQPVSPETVELFVYRPSDATRDFSVVMTEEGPGRYVADVSFPLIGVWDTLVAARNGDDEYHVGQRIEVRRP